MVDIFIYAVRITHFVRHDLQEKRNIKLEQAVWVRAASTRSRGPPVKRYQQMHQSFSDAKIMFSPSVFDLYGV